MATFISIESLYRHKMKRLDIGRERCLPVNCTQQRQPRNRCAIDAKPDVGLCHSFLFLLEYTMHITRGSSTVLCTPLIHVDQRWSETVGAYKETYTLDIIKERVFF